MLLTMLLKNVHHICATFIHVQISLTTLMMMQQRIRISPELIAIFARLEKI